MNTQEDRTVMVMPPGRFLLALVTCSAIGIVVGAYGATRYWTQLIIEGQQATNRALDQTERAIDQADRLREAVGALDDSEEVVVATQNEVRQNAIWHIWCLNVSANQEAYRHMGLHIDEIYRQRCTSPS